jgi:hypothetical protein
VATSGAHRVNFRPLKLITALRVVIAALLVAFGVVLFLSFGKKEEDAVRIQLASPPSPPGEQVVDLSENFAITGTKGGANPSAFRRTRSPGSWATRSNCGACAWRWSVKTAIDCR